MTWDPGDTGIQEIEVRLLRHLRNSASSSGPKKVPHTASGKGAGKSTFSNG